MAALDFQGWSDRVGAINAYEGEEFPGGQASIETSLGAIDCARLDTFEKLVKDLQEDGTYPTTIRHGRAYSEASVSSLAIFCSLP